MSKKIILFLMLGCFVPAFSSAQAAVVISEIMYAPEQGSNYEWVEIYNDGNESVDLSGWRFFRGENSGPLTLRGGNSAVLPAGGYAIIAKSPSAVGDYGWLNFSGMILSASTLSLPDGADNTSIAIASDVDKTINSGVTYDTNIGGSKESGTTLSNISGSWKGGVPTPGKANQMSSWTPPDEDEEVEDPDSGETSGNQSSGNASSSVPKKNTTNAQPKTQVVQKTKAEISTLSLAYPGIPFAIEGKAFGPDSKQLFRGRYFWNFGDGASRETRVVNADKFTHTYFYPGEYNLTLRYYPDDFTDVPDATTTTIIKVVQPEIFISSVGDEKDFFIELSNPAEHEADISDWILVSDHQSFKIPIHTIVAPNKKIIISSQVSGFSAADRGTLKLLTSQNETVSTYSQVATVASPIQISQTPVLVPASTQKEIKTPPSDQTIARDAREENILAEDLLASALVGSKEESQENSEPYMVLFATSLVFIGMSAGTVYIVRRKKAPPEPGDDFTVVD